MVAEDDIDRTALIVYPMSRTLLAMMVGGGLFVCVIGLIFVSDGAFNGSGEADVVIGGSFSLFGGLMIVAGVRAYRDRLPVLRLDSDGLECARGRLGWNAIERVEIVGSQTLRFLLRPGVRREPAESRYRGYTSLKKSRLTVRVAFAWREEYVVGLRRFYDGPID